LSETPTPDGPRGRRHPSSAASVRAATSTSSSVGRCTVPSPTTTATAGRRPTRNQSRMPPHWHWHQQWPRRCGCGSRRRRQAFCTWAACGRRCSTPSWRAAADRAAPLCCALRTRTRSGRTAPRGGAAPPYSHGHLGKDGPRRSRADRAGAGVGGHPRGRRSWRPPSPSLTCPWVAACDQRADRGPPSSARSDPGRAVRAVHPVAAAATVPRARPPPRPCMWTIVQRPGYSVG
jgi:hypothetical protein